MMLDKIKLFVRNNINKTICIRVNGSRNQVEEFSGKIIGAYNSIFIVRDYNLNRNKSFTYSDVLIGNVEFIL